MAWLHSHRRGFVALLGGAKPRVLIGKPPRPTLPLRVVHALAGSCSFCGRGAAEIRGLVGVVGLPARLCNECTDLVTDILAEQGEAVVVDREPLPESLDLEIFGADELWAQLVIGDELSETQLEELARQVKDLETHVGRALNRPSREKHNACSFCLRQRDQVPRLIKGPDADICEGCALDAIGAFLATGRL